MSAPEWYRTGLGPNALLPPPPELPTAQNPDGKPKDASLKQAKRAAAQPPSRPPPRVLPKGTPPLPSHQGALVPALPQIPTAPHGVVGAAQPKALPGALPALAVLPPPPPPAGGQIVSGALGREAVGGSAGQQVALALDDRKAGGVLAVSGNVGGGALVARAPTKSSGLSEKGFMIPGLQNRPYGEEELLLAFRMMDLDKHTWLTESDMRRVLMVCGESEPTDAELSEMVRLCDADGSGFVDWTEFRNFFLDPPAVFRNYDFHRIEKISADLNDGEDEGADDEDIRGDITPLKRSSSKLSQVSTSTPQAAPPDPRAEAVIAISGHRGLKPEFIKRVYQRFVEIDTDDLGFITFEAFCLVLRKAQTPAMRQVFDVFDCDKMGELDLRQFVVGLSMFTFSSIQEKLKFAFMMFDEDQQQAITRSEVLELVKAMAPQVPDQDRLRHVNRMYALHDLNRSMRISLEEFMRYITERAEELVPPTPTPTESVTGSVSGSVDGNSFGSTPQSNDVTPQGRHGPR
eukprot:TRINITY_DN56784_c0_g1_i1.p1 TRINITY_DN56784_c0_g1~~TRINITY_DN56784_c0_g1_i1.p1  ORF type:complete len:517 (+),score=104.44 TRINITY_DN56784_c0_g1_i1:80-1630(+)